MKPAGLFLFISAGFVTVLAAEDTSAGLASRDTKARIRESLPSYQPPPPKTDGTPGIEDTTPRDPDLLILPKMTVKEVRLPPDAADHLMSKRDFDRKMENLYLDSMAEQGPLNVILNSVAIPVLNPVTISLPPRRGQVSHRSVAIERGRGLYRARELDRLGHVTEAFKALDSEADKKFKQEMDNTHTTRPPSRK